MVSNKPIRQGEVLLLPVSSLLRVEVTKAVEDIVGYSESGHHHVLECEGTFDKIVTAHGETFLNLSAPASLRHRRELEQHRDIEVTPGLWQVKRKQKYLPRMEIRDDDLSEMELLDVGIKRTRLYRVRAYPWVKDVHERLHEAMTGIPKVHWEYFLYMSDASYPERKFIEWVAPEVGSQGNAELCQAVAFGITLEEWLSIEQEG